MAAPMLYGSGVFHFNDGFHYAYHTGCGTTLYFRCIRRSSCPARVIYRQEGSYERRYYHNHLPDYDLLQIRHERETIVSDAANLNYVYFRDLFERRDMYRNVRGSLTLRQVRSSLGRAHLRALPEPPSTLRNLMTILQDPTYECLTATHEFDDHLLRGSSTGVDGSCAIVLMSNRCRQMMRLSTFLFACTTPLTLAGHEQQYQVHSIGTVWDSTVISLAWVILDLNSQHAYLAGLSLLRSVLITWHFKLVVCDLHEPFANAYSTVFAAEVRPSLHDIIIGMCTVLKRVVFLELNQHQNDILMITKLCLMLPMVPRDLIPFAIDAIRKISRMRGDLVFHPVARVLSLISREWFEHPQRHMFYSVCGSVERTNLARAYTQQRMTNNLRMCRNDFYSVIRCLVRCEDLSHRDMQSIFTGVKPAGRRCPSLCNNESLKLLLKSMNETPVSQESQILLLLHTLSNLLSHVVDKYLL